MPEISQTATSILTILNNINELIVKASARKEASEVMRALRVYAKNKNFELPENKLQNFEAVLIDSKPITLTSLIQDIASDVIIIDRKKK